MILKIIEFIEADTNQRIYERSEAFLLNAGYEIKEKTEGKILFKQQSGVLRFWTFNPLDWSNEIELLTAGDKITVKFKISDSSYMKTYEGEQIWEGFIDDFENYTNGKTHSFFDQNKMKVDSNKIMKAYLPRLLVSLILSISVTILIDRYMNLGGYSIIFIPIITLLSFKAMIFWRGHKLYLEAQGEI